MQPIKLLEKTLGQNANSAHCLFSQQDFSSIFPDFTAENLRMLLSRAVGNDILERVCQGIYLYTKTDYDPTLILFKVASKLRADNLNYVSLETVLSQSGRISQQLLGWITVMTAGRSGIINCGRFGTVELIHTSKNFDRIMPELRLDRQTGMLWASEKLALHDMKDCKRSMDLVEQSEI